MKKFLGLIVFAALLSGCDDGEIQVKALNFSDATAQNCGNIIYKLNGTEALFFQIPYETSFLNDATPVGTPITIPIDGTANHRIFYRAYNGPVAAANICETVQPGTPQITEEWNATSGNIDITSTAVTVANTTPGFEGGEKIIRYRHSIVFRNVTYQNGQIETFYDFGTYDTTPSALPFNFDDQIDKCDSSNTIYNYNGSEAITLNIDPALILSQITPAGSPRIGAISDTENSVSYRTFAGQILASYFCTTPAPTTPAISQQWDAIDGTIEVTTTTNGTGFLHEIHLKNVHLKKGNSSFLLATDYLLGNLITN
ncbi:MAG: hypothetical protein EOO48_00665 [Flavobacterium sp.]|nr:MAG: hypothetical protein EOO48_00665 [Flavobacterium sp.]